jgi:hypothetical protein
MMATATAVTAIGLAATAHADPEYHSFQSPSGNVKCEMTINYKGTPYANCVVHDSAFVVPADKCDMSGAVNPQIGLGQGQTPTLSCVAASGEPVEPTLDFGQTQSIGTITCDSEPAGLTCTDTGTGHFVRASRDSYDLG